MKRDDLLANLALLGLCSSFVLPIISFMGFSLYLTTFISLILLFSLIFYKVKIDFLSFLIFLLCFIVFFSSLYSNAFGFSVYNFSNYLEAFKYFQYLSYLLVFMSFNRTYSFGFFLRYLNFSVYIYLFVFFIQLMNPIGLGIILGNMYLGGEDSQHLVGIETGNRLPITGANPNVGAVIGSFFTLFYLAIFVDKRNKFDFIIFLLCFISVFFTQSRTTLVGLIFVLMVFGFYSNVRIFYKILFPILLSFGVFFIFKFMELNYVVEGFLNAKKGDNNSLNARFDTMNMVLDVFKESPFFGVGPSKTEYLLNFDSEYLLILMRYGILGAVVFFTFISFLIFKSFQNRKNVIGLTLFLYSVLTLFVMLTNNAYSGYQLMSITVFLYIYLYCFKKHMEKL
ncbi:O-antigen ligase family protein [Acinetobacter sp. ANC 7200]|uniref:O-antigen ligase family protein n=1 Tax=Acinetobacter amyesii TaxID=2942470 RepID=UPI0020C1045A|nr:O-antigen ligase family protein [Acinetobacter amyesii]MCL6244585.1 O-antigen ligase family protein [Acinetobacter amyesii]